MSLKQYHSVLQI